MSLLTLSFFLLPGRLMKGLQLKQPLRAMS